MPLAFDPNCVIEFTFPADDVLPPAERPRYRARALTCRQEQEVERLFTEAMRQYQPSDRDLFLNAALGVALVGWSGLRDGAGNDVPFAVVEREVGGAGGKRMPCVEALDDLYTANEKIDRVRRLAERISNAEYELKKASPSPPVTATALSAGPATAPSAAAK